MNNHNCLFCYVEWDGSNCPKSEKSCKHHCNCSLIDLKCCKCGEEFEEDDELIKSCH